jgi:hypothetical protein
MVPCILCSCLSLSLFHWTRPGPDLQSTQLTMGTLVISAPTIPLARPAMIEFERACTLFQNTAISSVQPDNAAVSAPWWCISTPQCDLRTYPQVVLMDVLQTAKRAVDQKRPLVATPDSSTSAPENESTQWSSQSPQSVGSQQSWPSNSSSGSSHTPAPGHATNHHHHHHHHHTHHHPTNGGHEKQEYSPTAVTENLHQWWESATREF